ncbi:protein cornichon homolog 4 isoform X1 [Larus michahellis]|uniref:protein cornichon homolog 4 isoform X1 n=1 Tax=Larus michahellis TaxID=119627 RepID=UPI003D9B3E40
MCWLLRVLELRGLQAAAGVCGRWWGSAVEQDSLCCEQSALPTLLDKKKALCIWVVPEVIGHAVVTVLMLISLHWFIFLLNLPVATWNIYRYIMVPSGNMGVFDPTEIHNRGQLKSHMKEAMIKLGFHLLCFFMYLYSMILALIND